MARSILTPLTITTGGSTITSSAATSVPLLLKGAASQSANLQEWQSSAGTILSSITSSGALTSGSGTYDAYNADSTIRAEFRGTAGTHRPYIELQGVGANDVTNENGGAFIRFRTSRAAGYGADIGAVRKTGGASTLIFKTGVATLDAITQKMVIDENGNVLINGFASGTIGLTVRGASGQTANLYEIQNNSSVVLGGVTPAGRLYVQRQEGIQFMDGISTLRSRIYSAGTNGLFFDTGGGNVRVLTLDGGSETITGNLFYPYSSGRIGLIVRGVASQTADLLQLQNSGGTNQFRVDPAGMTIANSLGVAGSPSGISYAYFTTPVNNAVPVVVRGHATQTSDLTQWQLGDGSLRTFITANGRLAVRTGALGDGVANLYVGAVNTTDKPIVVRGASGQSANLQEWQADGGGILASLSSAGVFSAVSKSFVIDHPTKPGTKLRYGSLEGPENGVYVRGRSKDKQIELPEYWTELVDESTITVTLTPIGKRANLFIKEIKDNKIFIGGKKNVEYFYTVFAERKDIPKLIVEE